MNTALTGSMMFRSMITMRRSRRGGSGAPRFFPPATTGPMPFVTAGQHSLLRPDEFRAARFERRDVLACVAGCSHILPFIAGAIKIFAFGFNASAMHVSASSAMPCASLAMTLAVAGAMSSKSASSASSDVRRLPAFLLVVKIGDDRIARQRLERQRRDEPLRVGGHHHAHVATLASSTGSPDPPPCARRSSRSRPKRCFFPHAHFFLKSVA